MPLVYENDHVQLIHRPGPATSTLITFSWAGFQADGVEYWARPVAEKLDLNCLGFVARQPNWFFPDAMAPAVAAAQPYLQGQVLLYGSSMGAFAALKFSRALKADVAIALSPQSSIDPAIMPRTRYRTFFRPQWHTGMTISPDDVSGRCYVVFDPHYLEDLEHYQAVQRYPGIIPVHANFVDHDTVFIVGRTESARRLFALAAADDRKGLFQLFRERKKVEAWSLRSLATVCQAHGRFEAAASLLDRAGRQGLPSGTLNHLRFSLLRAWGRMEEAADIAKVQTGLPGQSFDHLRDYAEHLFAEKRWDAAAEGFEALLQTDKGRSSRHLHLRLAQSLRAARRNHAAVKAFESALQCWPQDQELRAGLCWAQLASGHFDCAISGFRALVAQRPDAASYHLGLIDSLRQAGRQAEARTAAQHALSIFPDSAQIVRIASAVAGLLENSG